jgi:hypothetical protein
MGSDSGRGGVLCVDPNRVCFYVDVLGRESGDGT